jgi:hypothetical protein
MATWFECKIKYESNDEYGKTKSVNESYLIDAVTFTDAEARLHKLLDEEIPFSFLVAGIKMAKVDEIVTSDIADCKWYKSRVIYCDVDEKSGKEKKTGHVIYVAGTDLTEALENLKQSQSSLMIAWEVDSISTSKILDIFPYTESERELKSKETEEKSDNQ